MHRVGRRCPGCFEFAANISRGARPHSPNAQSIPGMAAGVTERLWEIGDIVDVLEAWQRVRVGHVVLSTKVQYYLERAEHCERMAALAKYALTLQNLRSNGATWRDSTKTLEILRHNQTDPLPARNQSDRRRCNGKSSLW